MFIKLSENYIAVKFFQHCGKPTFDRQQNIYQGSCPICKEGKSWLKKRRCYYIVAKNVICCHNCGWHSSPIDWISRLTGLTNTQIIKDFRESDNEIIVNKLTTVDKPKIITPTLPSDSINLFDTEQVNFYNDNIIVKECLKTIKDRKLDKAVNKPKALYISLVDRTHCNRLVIPFYDVDNKILFYQSRRILTTDQKPKYLSRVGAEKSLYGVNNIKNDLSYLFLTEGPVDAMFIKNGIGVAGINEGHRNFTNTQRNQLQLYTLYKKIWVLDNQRIDNTSKVKTKKLLDSGETVFIWPKELEYKDVNELCISKQINQLDTDYILENSYTGLKGKLLLSEL